MSIKIFKRHEGIIRKISGSYRVANFLTKNSSKNISLAISKASNHSETTKNIRSDRVYFLALCFLKVL